MRVPKVPVETKSKKRGRSAEARFEHNARCLMGAFPIIKIEHASYREDQHGVDFIVTFLIKEERIFKAPVQVKSSNQAAKKYRRKYPLYIKIGIKVIVINEYKTDEEIQAELSKYFSYILEKEIDFRPLFALIYPSRLSITEEREKRRIEQKEKEKALRSKVPEFFQPKVCKGEHNLRSFMKMYEDIHPLGLVHFPK